MSSCLSLCGFSPLTTDKEAVLKGQIQAMASPDNPIRRIVGTFGRRRDQGYACDGLADRPLCGHLEGFDGLRVPVSEERVIIHHSAIKATRSFGRVTRQPSLS